MNLRIITKKAAETEEVAQKIGEKLQGGEVIELVSDLGGGKTTFVRGLARGTGSKDRVTSPTFTISNVYEGDKLNLIHFDFYRLNDAGLMGHELNETLGHPQNIIVIEWSGLVTDLLPKKRLTLHIAPGAEEARQLHFSYPSSLKYLVEGL